MTIYIYKKYIMTIYIYVATHTVKNPPAMQETSVRFLGQEDPLKKG